MLFLSSLPFIPLSSVRKPGHTAIRVLIFSATVPDADALLYITGVKCPVIRRLIWHTKNWQYLE